MRGLKDQQTTLPRCSGYHLGDKSIDGGELEENEELKSWRRSIGSDDRS